MAIASLVCGIFAIISCWFGPAGFIGAFLGLLAIIFGALGRKDENHKGMATAGLVLGIISLVLGIIMTIACVACMGVALSDFDADDWLDIFDELEYYL